MTYIDPITVTIVGGGGYIGYHVGVSMLERGHNVTLFDISEPDSFWLDLTQMVKVSTNPQNSTLSPIFYKQRKGSKTLKFVKGSLLDMDSLNQVIKGVDSVIHCASYGMSGMEQMPTQWDLTEQVNITGTQNVLKACQHHGVRSFVYTSSFNVVYGGQEIKNGDESLPYFPLHRHVDHYSRTKAIAERLVLFSDGLGEGTTTENPRSVLRTCALRLAGVMGLGEKRHLPRIVDYFKFMLFHYGYGESLQQFVTLKNVVQAHVKASEHLLLYPERIGGNAYFISDGEPMNTFEFLRPLREALGYGQPKIKMPMWVIWAVVYIIQFTHCLLSAIHPSLSFPPMLTPAEVYKTAVTHYFSSEKAKKDFGYCPQNPNDISDAIQYFCERQKLKKNSSTILQFIAILVLLLALLLYFIQ